MKKFAFFTILLLLAAWAQAQNIAVVSGIVTYADDGSPAPNHPVFCTAGDSLNPVYGEAITAPDGTYSIELDLPAPAPWAFVYTFTNCDPSGGFVFLVVDIADGSGSADFLLCNDSFPPSPDCFADFYAEPIDSLTFQFSGYYYAWDSIQGVSWLWDFGDGNTSTEQNPTHTYAQDGFYIVTLTVTGADGCVATVSYAVETTFNGFPDCIGYIMYSQIDTTTFDFSALIYDGDGNLTLASSYLWDFGDGNTSNDPSPTHTYADEGVYTVQLHATTLGGCELHACNVVFAFDCPIDTFWYGCQAMFYVGYGTDSIVVWPPQDPLTLSFFDISWGAAQSWAWDFGDGNTSTVQNPTHTYAAEGVYTVTLSIITIDGCESETSFEICVGNDCWGVPDFECQALFIPLPDSLGGNGLQFIDLSVAPVAIQSWSWNFGDGNSSNEQNPYHIYDQPGIYTVTLTIEADSCISSISFDVDTENPWLFANDPARLGVAPGAVSVKEQLLLEEIKLFPNPAQDNISLVFNSQKALAYELRISDLTGKTLRRTQQQANAGLNAIQLNVEPLLPGLYLAEIRSGESVQTLKFVKQ
ncbi:MAG: PKD domain-containing protein [Saprospiraceae bacterium]|nr:PKD domain-containing protein [Saprospiraceae bacterium]